MSLRARAPHQEPRSQRAPAKPSASRGQPTALQRLQRSLGNQQLQQLMRSVQGRAPEPVVTTRDWARDSGALWYLDGAKNDRSTPTQIDLEARTGGSGRFHWEVLAGSNKVELDRSTDRRVQLRSREGSHGQDDVVVQVTRSDADGTPLSVERGALGVRSPAGTRPMGTTTSAGPVAAPGPENEGENPAGAPSKLTAKGETHSPDATWGYLSLIKYEVIDDKGSPINGFDVNEKFGATVTADSPGCDWRQSTEGGYHSNSTMFADHIGGESAGHKPAPTAPKSPLGATKTQHWQQAWFIGSTTPGAGTKVQTNTFQKFVDHGEHTNIKSPP